MQLEFCCIFRPTLRKPYTLVYLNNSSTKSAIFHCLFLGSMMHSFFIHVYFVRVNAGKNVWRSRGTLGPLCVPRIEWYHQKCQRTQAPQCLGSAKLFSLLSHGLNIHRFNNSQPKFPFPFQYSIHRINKTNM